MDHPPGKRPFRFASGGFQRRSEHIKELVITADDLGMSRQINCAIAYCIDKGAVSAVSLSANGYAFDEAVGLLKQRDYPGVGLHITLVDGRPLVPAGEIKTLADNHGNFRKNCFLFVSAYYSRRISARDLEMEIEAQFRKVIDSGLRITHVDSHQHLHLLPGMLDIVIRLSRKYGVHFIRCPRAPAGRYWLFAPAVKVIPQFLMNIFFCAPARKRIIAEGLNTSDGSSGMIYSGILDRRKFGVFISSLKEGLCELICHPVLPEDTPAGSCRKPRGRNSGEYELLSSGVLKELLEKENIRLVPFPA